MDAQSLKAIAARVPLSVWISGASIVALMAVVEAYLDSARLPLAGRGLANVTGTDCYLNGVFQALAGVDTFVAHLRQRVSCAPRGATPLNASLLRLLLALNGHESGGIDDVFALRVHVEQLMGRKALAAGQQDAHEFLHALTDALDTEAQACMGAARAPATGGLAGALPSAVSSVGLAPLSPGVTRNQRQLPALRAPILSPLRGLLAAARRCMHCGHASPLHLQHFEVLTLSVTPETRTLEQALAAMATADIVDDVACDVCGLVAGIAALLRRPLADDDKAVLRTLIMRLPADVRSVLTRTHPGLLAHVTTMTQPQPLKTHAMLPASVRGRCLRLTAIARSPPVLCLHIARLVGLGVKLSGGLAFPDTLDISAGCLAIVGCEHARSSELYRLRAVLQHIGGAHGGHYVAYRRAPATADGVSPPWLFISDAAVHEVPWSTVAACEPYLLFYARARVNH